MIKYQTLQINVQLNVNDLTITKMKMSVLTLQVLNQLVMQIQMEYQTLQINVLNFLKNIINSKMNMAVKITQVAQVELQTQIEIENQITQIHVQTNHKLTMEFQIQMVALMITFLVQILIKKVYLIKQMLVLPNLKITTNIKTMMVVLTL